MKKLIALFLSIFSAFTANSQEPNVKHESILKKDLLIIDVRTLGEYNSGHIKGAKLIPYNEISKRIKEFAKDKNTPIALYCLSGSRSGSALRTLESMGYTKAVNYGGISTAKRILDNKK
jgi:phage shock protein E